jgi:hypothetical protein
MVKIAELFMNYKTFCKSLLKGNDYELRDIEFILKSFFQSTFICLHRAMLQKVHALSRL